MTRLISIREAFGGYTRDLGLIWGRNGTRLQLYNEVVSRYAHRVWRQRRNFLATPLEPSRDDVKKCVMASERNRLKRNPRSFGEATTSKILRHLPVPFSKDPYEAIKQPYLVKTETPESPYIVSSATPLIDSTPPTRDAEDSVDSDMSGARPTSSYFTTPLSPDHPLTHTTPTLVWFLRKTACMAVRVPPAMSPDLSVSIAKVAAMSDSAFCKRFRSSYESSPSSSPLDIPSQKRSRGTSKLVEDGEEEDEEEEGEEVEESLDSDSKSEDAEDE
ncbi:hypothetical protein Tco_1149503, partial [Tanacetum coccineum]